MTDPIHAALAGRGLLPAEHYLDSGYPSAALVIDSLRRWGSHCSPRCRADTSRQAKAGAGDDRAGFTIGFDAHQATCPQGQTSTWWSPATQRGTDAIVIKFAAGTCRPCPVRDQCTRSVSPRVGRQLTVPPPRGPPRPARRPSHPEHPGLVGPLRHPGRRRGHHPPGRRGDRDPPRTLPRPTQDQARTRVLSRRAQPDPPGRLPERTSPGPHQNQPPRPPRPRPGRLIELTSRVNDQLKTHLRGPGRVLRSRLPELAHQEIWAWLLVHHGLSALITRAAEAADLDPDRISFTRTLRLVRRTATGTAAFPP